MRATLGDSYMSRLKTARVGRLIYESVTWLILVFLVSCEGKESDAMALFPKVEYDGALLLVSSSLSGTAIRGDGSNMQPIGKTIGEGRWVDAKDGNTAITRHTSIVLGNPIVDPDDSTGVLTTGPITALIEFGHEGGNNKVEVDWGTGSKFASTHEPFGQKPRGGVQLDILASFVRVSALNWINTAYPLGSGIDAGLFARDAKVNVEVGPSKGSTSRETPIYLTRWLIPPAGIPPFPAAGSVESILIPPFARRVMVVRTDSLSGAAPRMQPAIDVQTLDNVIRLINTQHVGNGVQCPWIELVNEATQINVWNTDPALTIAACRVVFEIAL